MEQIENIPLRVPQTLEEAVVMLITTACSVGIYYALRLIDKKLKKDGDK